MNIFVPVQSLCHSQIHVSPYFAHVWPHYPPLSLLPTSYCSPSSPKQPCCCLHDIHEHTHTHALHREKKWCFSFFPPLLSCLLLTLPFSAFHSLLVPFLFSHHVCMHVCTYESRFYIWERYVLFVFLSLSYLAYIMTSDAIHFSLVSYFILLYG